MFHARWYMSMSGCVSVLRYVMPLVYWRVLPYLTLKSVRIVSGYFCAPSWTRTVTVGMTSAVAGCVVEIEPPLHAPQSSLTDTACIFPGKGSCWGINKYNPRRLLQSRLVEFSSTTVYSIFFARAPKININICERRRGDRRYPTVQWGWRRGCCPVLSNGGCFLVPMSLFNHARVSRVIF